MKYLASLVFETLSTAFGCSGRGYDITKVPYTTNEAHMSLSSNIQKQEMRKTIIHVFYLTPRNKSDQNITFIRVWHIPYQKKVYVDLNPYISE